MNVPLDVQTLEYVVRRRIEEGAEQLASQPGEVPSVRKLNRLLDLVRSLPFPVNLWETQNTVYVSLSKLNHEPRPESEHEAPAENWAHEVSSLKENLGLQNP